MPIDNRVWWRLEVRGRPGWFKPAADAILSLLSKIPEGGETK